MSKPNFIMGNILQQITILSYSMPYEVAFYFKIGFISLRPEKKQL